jgi:hypothetical protein
MMKNTIKSTRLYGVVLTIGTLIICSSARASDNAMACVKEIAIPSAYSTVITKIPATVEARILIGDYGTAESVTYDTNLKLLIFQLDAYFKEKTKYVDSCKGRTITMIVQYTVVEPEVDFPTSEVHFEPPDRFRVICHRIRPALDPVRPDIVKK